MAERGIDIAGRPTKSLTRFARSRFDRVITLCDKVREICPEFPGAPIAAHWSIADPAAAGDTDEADATPRSSASPTRSRAAWRCCSPTSEPDHRKGPTMADAEIVNVRYLVDDVAAAVDFYTRHFGFTVGITSPAFADVTRGNLRLLLSGPQSSAGKAMTDGERPGPGGWNRIHLIVDDLDGEVARLTEEGVEFRNEVVTGPGGAQVLAIDPSGNLVELFQPAAAREPTRVSRPGIDHIALTVPDLDEHVDRLTTAFGMVVEHRFDWFALVADPASGLKIELSRSDDSRRALPPPRLLHRRRRRRPRAPRRRRHGVQRGAAPARLRPHVHLVPQAARAASRSSW